MSQLVPLSLEELEASINRTRQQQTFAEQAQEWSRDLRKFIGEAWHVLEPKTRFVPNWHIDAICEHLESARHGEIQRLLINVPPRHMKSLTVSVFWPAWRWTFEPHLKFLTASFADQLAQRDAVKSRDLILSRWYQARWPHVQLKGDVNRLSRYENTDTGYRIATHVGGGTGDGGDVLILDDPHQAEEAISDTKRSAVISWYGNTWASRFNDPETGVEVIVMQRLHEGDMAGHVLEREGRWTHLCLPARFEPKHPFAWPDDPRSDDGELLWPDRISERALTELSMDMTERVAAGQLQQRPAPREGAMLRRADWRYYPPSLSFYSRERFGAEEVERLPVFGRIVHSWDTSVKDREHSDFVAGGVWGVHGADRYLLRLWRGRAGLNATIEAMLELSTWALHLWPETAQNILIEAAANGPDAIAEIKRRVQGVVAVASKGSKEMRAEAAAPALESGNCYLPGYPDADLTGYDPRTPADVQLLVEECASFPHGKHDDQVDQFTQMLNWTRRRASTAIVSVPGALR